MKDALITARTKKGKGRSEREARRAGTSGGRKQYARLPFFFFLPFHTPHTSMSTSPSPPPPPLPDDVNLLVGYDAGEKSALAGVTAGTDVQGKAVDVGATWFQAGNHIRTEGRVQLAEDQALWATKTLNDANDVGNATVVNLAERKAFVIEPFNIPVSTAAAKYSIEREGYLVEPAYDFNTKAAFLSVTKTHNDFTIRPQYAFADEVALVEVAWNRDGDAGRPLVRAFAKAPAGPKGLGPIQIGVIGDKAWEF